MVTPKPDDSPSKRPYWREQAKEHVEPYLEGLELLAGALEFSFERLQAIELTSDALAGAGGRAVLPILAARAVGTVDAIHALLALGRVEQADMLTRTLIDLQADAYLLAADESAVGYYADWATVEQARTALVMRPDEILRPGRDLEARRRELANDLLERLTGLDQEQAENLVSSSLEEILAAFCRKRYGSRRPPSWRWGYRQVLELTDDDLRQVIIGKAVEIFEYEQVPDALRSEFKRNFERELELLFGYLSGEIHNSPLSMNRLIDQTNWTIRVHGDIPGVPRTLASAFQHLLRIMLLFESQWSQTSAHAEWFDRATAVSEWMDQLVEIVSAD